ncbi:hypothetical protein C8Q78DRAFT_607040 [Trametes maxima]|nr:hypothetical protein C8Q78DRAFT_607040 [Trametes maxima]
MRTVCLLDRLPDFAPPSPTTEQSPPSPPSARGQSRQGIAECERYLSYRHPLAARPSLRLRTAAPSRVRTLPASSLALRTPQIPRIPSLQDRATDRPDTKRPRGMAAVFARFGIIAIRALALLPRPALSGPHHIRACDDVHYGSLTPPLAWRRSRGIYAAPGASLAGYLCGDSDGWASVCGRCEVPALPPGQRFCNKLDGAIERLFCLSGRGQDSADGIGEPNRPPTARCFFPRRVCAHASGRPALSRCGNCQRSGSPRKGHVFRGCRLPNEAWG